MAEYTDFGFMRPGNGEETKQLYQKEVENYKKYMEHPSYKERLGRELFGDKKIDKNVVEEEYKRRLQKLPTVKIMDVSGLNAGEAGHYQPSENILRATDSPTFYHEMTHAMDKSPSMFGVADDTPFTDIKEKYVTYPVKALKDYRDKYGQYIAQNIKTLQEKLVKDLDEGVISPPSYLTKNQYREDLLKYDPKRIIRNPSPEQGITQEYINKFNSLPESQFINKAIEAEDKEYRLNWIDYLKDDSEMKAKINSLRLQAIDKYNYDPSKPFNINDFPELKKDWQYKQLTEDLKMTDEDIMNLSKYIARIPSANYLQQAPQRQAQYQALQNMA
jgi:hypothetical protein